jgi:hypothetical protein
MLENNYCLPNAALWSLASQLPSIMKESPVHPPGTTCRPAYDGSAVAYPLFIVLQTDDYAGHTSIALFQSTQRDSKKVVFENLTFYSNKDYKAPLCLPASEYTFGIEDSEGEGIYCNNFWGIFYL